MWNKIERGVGRQIDRDIDRSMWNKVQVDRQRVKGITSEGKIASQRSVG